MALRRTDVVARAASELDPATSPDGFGPADLASAYDLPGGSTGQGVTVAIVDAYDLPTAAADLATYRTQYGLPPCTVASGCFRKVDEYGGTSYPAANAGWDGEISLDLDMVSATCPKCKILLVEATSAYTTDLGTAVNTAVSLGAVAVSNSYGGPEYSGETSADSYFNHPGVAITASTGDCGYDCAGNYYLGYQYPAASPYVVAVGGTALVTDGSALGWTESVWGNATAKTGAGSGCSAYEAKPAWQTDASCANRMEADVSAVADPATGVAVYDSNGGGWAIYGGTSASSPIIASIFAMAHGKTEADYPAQYLYADPADLYDVTSGSNDIWSDCTITYECTGVVGYDGPSGLGTPKGTTSFGPNALVTHLKVSGILDPFAAGSKHSFTVKALDAHGNVVTGYTGKIHFTSSDTQAILPADYTFTASDNGVHTFANTLSPALTLETAGSRSVTATDKARSSIKGSQTVTVTPGAAKTLAVSGIVNPYAAGSKHSVTVKALDAYGNVATAYTGTIHFTSSDTQATLPADYTFTASDKGAHAFASSLSPALTLKTAGSKSVTATDMSKSTISGSMTVKVTPGAARSFRVAVNTNPWPGGSTHTFSVTALDAYGNVATGYTGTVHFTISDSSGTVPTDYTFTPADKGAHSFSATVKPSLTFKSLGTQWVRATDKSTPSITGSQTVTVI